MMLKGALDGIRVVDLSSVIMGPFAAQLLGDMGADRDERAEIVSPGHDGVDG